MMNSRDETDAAVPKIQHDVCTTCPHFRAEDWFLFSPRLDETVFNQLFQTYTNLDQQKGTSVKSSSNATQRGGNSEYFRRSSYTRSVHVQSSLHFTLVCWAADYKQLFSLNSSSLTTFSCLLYNRHPPQWLFHTVGDYMNVMFVISALFCSMGGLCYYYQELEQSHTCKYRLPQTATVEWQSEMKYESESSETTKFENQRRQTILFYFFKLWQNLNPLILLTD